MTICQKCGDNGDQKKLVFCIKCEVAAEHRYCLDKLAKDDEEVHWTCYDCTPPEAKQPPVVVPSRKSERICSKKQVKLRKTGVHKQKGKTTPFNLEALAAGVRAYCRSPLLKTDTEAQNTNNQSPKPQENTGRRRRFILPDEDSDEEYEAEYQPSCNQFSGKNELGEEKRLALEGVKVYEESKLVETETKTKDEPSNKISRNQELQALGMRLINKDKLGHDVSKPPEVEAFHSAIDTWQGTLSKSCQMSYVKPEKYVPAGPANDPIWKGRLNIKNATSKTIFGICAHDSTKASPNVRVATSGLPSSLDVEKTMRRPGAWPKSFEVSPPSIECIGIYLFPLSERDERIFDGLLTEMIDRYLALKAVISNSVELLVFSSFLLPPENRRRCGKYFLWGVYRTRKQDYPSS